MEPVPDYPLADTPYGRRGPYWSCDRDEHGNGIHTGVDFGAPVGARVVAARPGQLVWCDHGSAFGDHQVEVRCEDGTRDFYAHMSRRYAEGPVAAGDPVGEVGAEGNVTGPHLHFERHAIATGGWSCSIVRDPAPSIQWQGDEMNEADWDRMRELIESIWSDQMQVTQPSGQDVHKSREQVLRETYQGVKKAT